MHRLSRRRLLTSGAFAACATLAAPAIARLRDHEKRLEILNLHTGESLSAVIWAEGAAIPEELERVNRVMRDHRTGEVTAIDPALLLDLHGLRDKVGSGKPYHLISGYRSAQTNARLLASTDGVAENSFHVRGQAADVRLPGTDLLRLRRAARSMKSGGVGYYPLSDFLHLDTGPLRFW
ncbi:MAG: DUF882 domain-containing protein [Kiloniellales bacterium]|nr:DUF882 domain-containing protein [Kiloniellales bacterium]